MVIEVDQHVLDDVSVFSTLRASERSSLIEAAGVTDHEPGEMLTSAGTIVHRFHLLLDGEVVVEREGRQVATLGPGEFVGEIGLLGGGPATADVRCTRPTRCLTLRREAFWAVLEEKPAIALRILEVVCRRLEREYRPGPTHNLSGE